MSRLERYQQERIEKLEALLAESIWVDLDGLLRFITTPEKNRRSSLLDRLRKHEKTVEKTKAQEKRFIRKFMERLRSSELPMIISDTPPAEDARIGVMAPVMWEKSERCRYFHLNRMVAVLQKYAY